VYGEPEIVIVHKKGCKISFDGGETWEVVRQETAEYLINKYEIPYYNGGTDFSIYQKGE